VTNIIFFGKSSYPIFLRGYSRSYACLFTEDFLELSDRLLQSPLSKHKRNPWLIFFRRWLSNRIRFSW